LSAFIDAAFSRSRLVVLLLILLFSVGLISYVSIAKESWPEIVRPTFFINTGLDGISPSDSERLLVEPLERELGSLPGLDRIESFAGEGSAYVIAEFRPGGNVDEALDNVREAVDRVQGDMPSEAYDITVAELDMSQLPIMLLILSGPVPERTLNQLADSVEEVVSSIDGVLEVGVVGKRSEFIEVLIDPTVFQTYSLSYDEVISQITRNNQLIAAGAIDSGTGRVVLKVPGLIEDLSDVLNMPIKVRDGTVVTFEDVAEIRRTFREPTSFSRINGQPSLTIEVVKNSGANIISTADEVRQRVNALQADWPESVQMDILQDQSEDVSTVFFELQANVIAAVVLVFISITFAMGFRSAILVGLSIPGAFLTGVAALWALGYTLSFIVLFALILVVGMLVDGAIVTTELADRRLQDGDEPKEAYSFAAKRMAWPIIASAATTISVFVPLLFWNSFLGQIMKPLPVTLIVTLTASVFMALIFIPVVGGLIGRAQPRSARAKEALYHSEYGDPRKIGGMTGTYIKVLRWAIIRPGAVVLGAVALLLASFGFYAQMGNGVTLFPSSEPNVIQLQISSRDNISIYERDRLVRLVEDRLWKYDEASSIYAQSSLPAGRGDEETIGTINLILLDWDLRRKAALIAEDIREDVSDIPGISVQVSTPDGGPTAGKPISIQVIGGNKFSQSAAVDVIKSAMASVGGFVDITDTKSLPGVELSINVDRVEAARYGADVNILGQSVQLLTQGIEVASYRPEDATESLSIRVRFPSENRSLAELGNLRVPTQTGLVPVSNFVGFQPTERLGAIRRIDENPVVTIEANIAPGLLVADQNRKLLAEIRSIGMPEGVDYKFGGDAQDMAETFTFLLGAFISAIFLMFMVLLVQFNRFDQALIILSAIVFSVGGVLIGLLVMGRPFGLVMSGIGVIALAGIVVNNNIVLIDTFNQLIARGQPTLEAALRTGAQRLRPVMLTTITTALGLMPMVFGLSISLIDREIVQGAPSTAIWVEMSSAIVGGLLVATVLTLVVTPAMLVLAERKSDKAKAQEPNLGTPDALDLT